MKKLFPLAVIGAICFAACNNQDNSQSPTQKKEEKMEPSNKEKVVDLLKTIETGDTVAISYINPNKYIQRNLGAADGLAGLELCFSYCRQNLQK